MRTEDDIPTDKIRVLCVDGAAISDSRLFPGFLTVDGKLVTKSTSLKEPAKIAILQFSLDRVFTVGSAPLIFFLSLKLVKLCNLSFAIRSKLIAYCAKKRII
jgi:hypothetical protein